MKIQESLCKLDAQVTMLWIPAHCDIDGKEKADELANGGAKDDQTMIPISNAIVAAKIKKSKKWKSNINLPGTKITEDEK